MVQKGRVSLEVMAQDLENGLGALVSLSRQASGRTGQCGNGI